MFPLTSLERFPGSSTCTRVLTLSCVFLGFVRVRGRGLRSRHVSLFPYMSRVRARVVSLRVLRLRARARKRAEKQRLQAANLNLSRDQEKRKSLFLLMCLHVCVYICMFHFVCCRLGPLGALSRGQERRKSLFVVCCCCCVCVCLCVLSARVQLEPITRAKTHRFVCVL